MDVCLTNENVYDIIVNKMGWEPIDAASFLRLAVKAQKENSDSFTLAFGKPMAADITMPAWFAEAEAAWNA